MEKRSADIFLGYKEFRTKHYNKWEKAQSKRYFEYRKKWVDNAKNLIVEEFPLHLDIAITNACNLACTFCARTVRVEEGTWRKTQHMSLELFKKIIDDAVELGTYSINLNLLNEPLIHPDLPEMIHYAKDKGIIDVHFHTHGGLLTPDKVESLLESGLDRLLLSLDTPYKEKYNKIRVFSDFDLVMDNLKQFKKTRDDKGLLSPTIRVSCIQFPETTVEEIHDAKTLFLQFADSIGFQQYVDPRKEVGKDIEYTTGYKSNFVCHQPFTRLSIIEDGRVSPCCIDYDQELIIGDVNKQSLKSIWESKKLNDIRETLKQGECYKISACATCEKAVSADQGIHMINENTEPTH